MAFNLRNRSYLTLADFNTREMEYLLDLAEQLKKDKYAGVEQPRLKGKNIALIFEKDSTRTRCSFEVGAPRSRRSRNLPWAKRLTLRSQGIS